MNPSLEDVCMAHRWLYYGRGKPVISDYEYDRLEEEALKSCGPDSPLHKPGSDSERSYTPKQLRIAQRMVWEAAK